MSQVDFINYIPLIFWFIVFFIILYGLLYTCVLPLIYSALKTRNCFLEDLIKEIKKNFILKIYFFKLSILLRKINLVFILKNWIKFIKINLNYFLKIN